MITHVENKELVRQRWHFERAKLTVELDSLQVRPEFQYTMRAALGDSMAEGRTTTERARRGKLTI
jgi:hypothetical protein